MATWDEDQEDEIIRYVRDHPCFYDTRSPDYKNRDLRSAEWENLAGKFDVSVPIMKAKWKALNDSYNRCMREKNAARSGSGADGQIKPKWVHFDKMKFLAPFRMARETQTTLVADAEEHREVVDLTKDKTDGLQQEQLKEGDGDKCMAPPPPSTPIPKKRKAAKVPDSPSLDDAFKATLATITEQMNKPPSETQLFTDHVGAQLDKLTARRQLKAKNAIQRVIPEALEEQYAEEEAARTPLSSPAWHSQILPPTQQSQYPDHAYYPPHPSLLASHPSRPHSTTSGFSSVGYASSPGSSSDSNTAVYTGLSAAAQFES